MEHLDETIHVLDDDGNGAGMSESFDNVDTAIREAARIVTKVWPDYGIARVCVRICTPEGTVLADGEDLQGPAERVIELATVERAGPWGSTRIRVAMAGAGWIAAELDAAPMLAAMAMGADAWRVSR